jgi:hypothetical protein
MAGRPVWNQPLDCPISVIEIIGQFAEKYNSTSKFPQIRPPDLGGRGSPSFLATDQLLLLVCSHDNILGL